MKRFTRVLITFFIVLSLFIPNGIKIGGFDIGRIKNAKAATPITVGPTTNNFAVTTVGTATSVTINNYTTGTGDNRLMLVGVSWNCGSNPRTITGISFNYDSSSVTLSERITQETGSTAGRFAAIWYAIDPPSGVTGSVTVSFSGTVSNGIVAGVATFAGVDPATPFTTWGGQNSSTTGTTQSVTLTGLSGDELIFDTVFIGGTANPTIGADQTGVWNANGMQARGAASYEDANSSSSVTMSWSTGSNVVWAIAAVAINPAPVGPTYALTMAVSPAGWGTTTPAIGTHNLPQDELVDITAIPATGYQFNYWEPEFGGGIANPYQASTTVLLDGDKTVTAHFELLTYDLTVNIVGNGTVSKDPDIIGPYDYGTEVELTAIPDSGWLFSGWSEDLSGNVNPESIIMTEDRTVTATFIEIIPGTVYLDGPVSSDVDDDVSSISFAHTTGTGANRLLLVGISWNPNADVTIDSVSFIPFEASAVSMTEEITRKREDNHRYAAIYSLLVDDNGITSGQSGTVLITFTGTVNYGIAAGAANFMGVNQTVPIDIKDGNDTYSVILSGLDGDELVFDTVFAGGNPPGDIVVGTDQTELWYSPVIANTRGTASIEQASGSSVEMSWDETTNQWAHVAVAINPMPAGPTYDLTIAVDPEGGGTTTPSAGLHTYAENSVVDVSATPNEGYAFDHWEGACTGTDPCQVTMTENKSVTAFFTALPQYTLTVGIAGNGSVTLDPTGGTYYEGTTVTLTSVSGACYEFGGWSGEDAGDITGTGPYTIFMDENKSVIADFGRLPAGMPCYRVNAGGDTLTALDASLPDFLALHYGTGGDGLDDIPGLTVGGVVGERSTDNTISMTNVGSYLPEALFKTVLYNDGAAGTSMTFDFEVPNGTYTVLLHNAEHNFSSSGLRIVDIYLEGVLEFDDYDYYDAAGGQNIARTETIEVSVTDGFINIAIENVTSVGIIRGIEIIPAGTGTIIIEKQTSPEGWTDPDFEFTGDATGFIGDGEQITLSNVVVGAYHVQEVVPAGWTLSSIVCDDDNSNEDLPNFEADIQLDEDETVTCVFNNLLPLDYGDAPDSYSTLLASDGARHVITVGHSLGSMVDSEADGQPSTLANGDDLNTIDDEDGVLLPSTLLVGDPSAQVSVDGGPSGGYLDAWIDYNNNGVFDHPGEHLWGFSYPLSAATPTLIPFSVPTNAVPGSTYARFRLSSAGSLLPYGFAPDGEVEDYQVEILAELSVTDLDLWQSENQTDWDEVPGSYAEGFKMVLDPSVPFYYLDTNSITANRALADGYYEFFVDTVPTGFFEYWEGRGVFDGCTGTWEPTMWQIISGEEPIFYLLVSGTDYMLVDGLLKQLGQGDQYLRIEGTYHLGDYTFTGTVADGYGYSDEVSVDITFLEPLEITDLDLWQSENQVDWKEVSGSFAAGFEMGLETWVKFYYLDTNTITVNRVLADGYYEFFVDTVPTGFFEYWQGRGVFDGCTGTWEPTMWEIISGEEPIFYLLVSGTDYMLVDGLQKQLGQGDHYLRIEGDYWPGVYAFSGSVMDEEGFSDDILVTIEFTRLFSYFMPLFYFQGSD